MKKTSMVLIMLVGSIAFASSLSIPWYVDNSGEETGLPPTKDGSLSLIYLKSTVQRVLTCEIAYYNEKGDYLGPNPLFNGADGKKMVNTFTIQPLAALGFRPVADDPISGLNSPWDGHAGTLKGQEGAAGVAVPNRPRSNPATATIPGSANATGQEVVDGKRNGSITITWSGDGAAPTDLQGSQMAWAKGTNSVTVSGVAIPLPTVVSFSHLLPPGK